MDEERSEALRALEELDPAPDDYDELLVRARQGSQLAAATERAEALATLLRGDGSGTSVGEACQQLLQEADGLSPSPGEDWAEAGHELTAAARRFLPLVEDQGATWAEQLAGFDRLQSRVASYQSALRRYRFGTVAELAHWRDELQQATGRELALREELRHALTRWTAAVSSLRRASEPLTAARQREGQRFAREVEGELQRLGFSFARLEVSWEPIERPPPDWFLAACQRIGDPAVAGCQEAASQWPGLSRGGREKARLRIATADHRTPLPLAEVLSGGEVSRLTLAIKTVLAKVAAPSTLVLDEVDSGISGRTAAVVGDRIAELASRHQVICVSHLPQIVAQAHDHLLVTRQEDRIAVRRLGREEERVREIARLTSGHEVLPAGLENARRLIREAHQGRFNA